MVRQRKFKREKIATRIAREKYEPITRMSVYKKLYPITYSNIQKKVYYKTPDAVTRRKRNNIFKAVSKRMNRNRSRRMGIFSRLRYGMKAPAYILSPYQRKRIFPATGTALALPTFRIDRKPPIGGR